MKRDMDIIRRIALAVSELPEGEDLLELPEVDAITFAEHVRWMMEADFVKGHVVLKGGGRTTTENTFVSRLTWKGCDFVDSINM